MQVNHAHLLDKSLDLGLANEQLRRTSLRASSKLLVTFLQSGE
jgi:hypothetical protein